MSRGCKRCPNGSFVAFDKAPGKYHQDCQSCPLGKTRCLKYLSFLLITVKDVRAKIFHLIDFLKFLLQSDNELLPSRYLCRKCEKKRKKIGGHRLFVSDIKRVENYPDFDKLAHVTQHGLQGFIVENIEGELTEANDLSLIL